MKICEQYSAESQFFIPQSAEFRYNGEYALGAKLCSVLRNPKRAING